MMLQLVLAAALQAAPSVDICAVVDDPQRYDDQRMSIVGEFLTDWRHGHVISGENCGGMFIYLPADRDLGVQWRRVEALETADPLPHVMMRLEGVFRWNPDATGTWAPVRAIDVEKVSDVVITPRESTS